MASKSPKGTQQGGRSDAGARGTGAGTGTGTGTRTGAGAGTGTGSRTGPGSDTGAGTLSGGNPKAGHPHPHGAARPQPHDVRTERPDVEELPPRRLADNTRETVDLVHRPGPGEREDAERPLAEHDSESQNGGRSVEEEMLILSDDDDAGGLPNQQIANRGPLPSDVGRQIPEGTEV